MSVFYQRYPQPRRLVLSLWIVSICLAPNLTFTQNIAPDVLIADSLAIQVPLRSDAGNESLTIKDFRKEPGRHIGIRQVTKYGIIPVDQYLVMDHTVKQILRSSIPDLDSCKGDTLIIEALHLWYDDNPLFAGGWKLNGSTRLVDSSGAQQSRWYWELRAMQDRKKQKNPSLGMLMGRWSAAQGTALSRQLYHPDVPDYTYRRALTPWIDTIFLLNGYIINARLTLDYPADQMESYTRGAPGIYYRSSPQYQSLAIGGWDQQWYRRLNARWLGRLNLTGRIGFNSFSPDHFDYVKWWNVFLVNAGLSVSVEYLPQYHRGFFAGIGLHQSANLLPEITPRFATGLVVTIGVRLP